MSDRTLIIRLDIKIAFHGEWQPCVVGRVVQMGFAGGELLGVVDLAVSLYKFVNIELHSQG